MQLIKQIYQSSNRIQHYCFGSLVSVSQHNKHISIIKLQNSKKRNALSQDLLSQLHSALDLYTQDRLTKVLILKAEGPVFSSGHDLKEIQSCSHEQNKRIFETLSKICILIRTLNQPVIAQVDGLATAGGCQLALACDLIVVSKKSSFCTPGLKVGLFCTTPGIELARALPSQKVAMEMLLTADPISSSDAHRLGLVNKVCDSEEIDEVTIKLAEKIGQFSGESIALGKKTFYEQSSEKDLQRAYNIGVKSMTDNLGLDDCKEGISAFSEKRHPNFIK